MRVSQVQNLTWAGNVLVLAGLAWVGVQFWNANKIRQKALPEFKWDMQKATNEGPRWPGDVGAFAHIWQTPINGKVPPPPPPPNTVVVKVDKVAEFKAKLKYLGGWEFPEQPEQSVARVNFDGKDASIRPGGSIGGFQLIAFGLDDKKKTATMTFRSIETGEAPFTVEQPQSQAAPLSDSQNPPFKPSFGPGIAPLASPTAPLTQQGYQHPKTGDWIIPEEEQQWMTQYGEDVLLKNLGTKPDVDAQGVSHGLRITSLPEAGTPLAPNHGVGLGDVVRSINGEPVASKEDIVTYLRGKGKGLEKYVVVIDTNGKEHTVVYVVRRRRS